MKCQIRLRTPLIYNKVHRAQSQISWKERLYIKKTKQNMEPKLFINFLKRGP